jgi:hypothetical protein
MPVPPPGRPPVPPRPAIVVSRPWTASISCCTRAGSNPRIGTIWTYSDPPDPVVPSSSSTNSLMSRYSVSVQRTVRLFVRSSTPTVRAAGRCCCPPCPPPCGMANGNGRAGCCPPPDGARAALYVSFTTTDIS